MRRLSSTWRASIVLLAIISVTAFFVIWPRASDQVAQTPGDGGREPASLRPDASRTSTGPTSPAELCSLSPESLGELDVETMNVLCAEGLPGSESLSPGAVRSKLDAWAMLVRAETERHLYRATDPRYAEHYRHSESYLRAEFLLQTLQERCGVRYNPDSILSPSFSDSRDLFIHGLTDHAQVGTCASMPVLYAAIGRRLGYPIRLVQAKGHLFCRWDDPFGDCFNIEGTNGFTSYPDDLYRKWPYEISDQDLASREYLVSLTPAEELAVFLAARGHCLMDAGRFDEALAAYQEMARRAPTFKVHSEFVRMAQIAVERGAKGLEDEYGHPPHRVEPPPIPAEFSNPSRGKP